MPFKGIFTVIFLCITTVAWSQSETDSAFKAMSWLEGSWQGTYNGAPFYEAWKFHNGRLLNFSIEIKGKDTIVQEQNAIHVIGKKIFLGTKAVKWELKRWNKKEIMFENDTAKYSNRIIWLHLDNDHWFTILQHPRTTAYYDMVRVKELDPYVENYFLRIKDRK